VGQNFNDQSVGDLVVGETNKEQVLQMFGAPFNKGSINANEVFIYSYEENEFSDYEQFEVYINKRYKSLFVLFDQDNRVKYYTHNIPAN
jgi:outer membrane protein assembly factor BamE (lipoprotein component of BamABCDE complex)